MRYGVKQLLVAMLLSLFFPISCQATESFDQDQIAAVGRVQAKMCVVKELSDSDLISHEQAAEARKYFCAQAEHILGHAITPEQLGQLVSRQEKAAGFGIFLNSIIVLAGISLVVAAIGLIAYYLRDFLKLLPKLFYECLAYVVTLALLICAYFVRPFSFWFLDIQPLHLAIPAALSFPACVWLSYTWHWKQHERASVSSSQPNNEVYAGPGLVSFPTVLSGLCALFWTSIAICFHLSFHTSGIPYFIAFIATMALQSFLGFSIITLPGCIAMGWTEKKRIPRSTFASFLILSFYVTATLQGSSLPEFVKLFNTGCIFMGAFVFYLGLLLMSSKRYCWTERCDPKCDETSKKKGFYRYLLLQAMNILFGFAALYLGSTFGISVLLGIGGTFFTLYLLEKYYELPWRGIGWAWSLLGVAIALYFFVGFAGQHPQLFIWGIRL